MKDRTGERLKRLRRSLAARNIQAALITGQDNRFYLSGFKAEDLGLAESAGALLITRHEQILLTDGRYDIQARKEAPGYQVVIYKKGLARQLRGIFQRLEVSSCAYEPAYISCSRFEHLTNTMPAVQWQPLGDILSRMRLIKDRDEYTQLKKAQEAAEKVFEMVLPEIVPGRSEKEIAFMILEGLYKEAEGPSFPPIVASGPNSALPHAMPGNRKIKKAEPVIIDMGARIGGYCSDMTRTIFCDEPSPELKEIYMTVKNAQDRAQRQVRPGMTCREADGLARKIINEAGFGRYFVHSLGHGVGIAIHEAPTLSQRSAKRLKTGMVFTVEPGIYIRETGGVRLENMGILEQDGLDILTSNKWFYDF